MPASRTRNYPRSGLEVNTDLTSPRAYHNAHYVTPSHDQYAYPQSPSTSTLYSPTTEYSPTTAYSPTSSSSPTWSPTSAPSKRRKSSADAEQLVARPKKGDEDYVKRPENAFILFRRRCCEDRQAALDASASTVPVKKQRQADLSKTISQQWKALPASERSTWEALAKERKKEHEQLHPGYVYRPQRVKGRAAAARRASLADEAEPETSEVVFVPPFSGRGRSASSPDAMQLPPSLMPMINSGPFDFVPQTFPSFGQHSDASFVQYPPFDYSEDPFTSNLLPAHEVYPYSSSSSTSSTTSQTPPPTTPNEYPAYNDDGAFDVPYGSYGAWDDAAMAMWPQQEEQGGLLNFNLNAIMPVQAGGYEYEPEYTYSSDLYAGYEVVDFCQQ